MNELLKNPSLEVGSKARSPEFVFKLCYLLAMWTKATSLRVSHVICKKEIPVVTVSIGSLWENLCQIDVQCMAHKNKDKC